MGGSALADALHATTGRMGVRFWRADERAYSLLIARLRHAMARLNAARALAFLLLLVLRVLLRLRVQNPLIFLRGAPRRIQTETERRDGHAPPLEHVPVIALDARRWRR